MKGSLSSRSELFSFSRPDNRTFFDFQIAAITHCESRMRSGLPAVLALDTGLGKTCVIRGVIDRLRKQAEESSPRRRRRTALVIVPSGLVRQITASLARYPWESRKEPPSCTVRKVETGKEARALLAEPELPSIVVLNRSLGEGQRFMQRSFVVVLDEAHQDLAVRSIPFSLRGLSEDDGGSVMMLFATASPNDAKALLDWFRAWLTTEGSPLGLFSDSCFVVEKTPYVRRRLGVADPVVKECPIESSCTIDNYVDRVLAGLRYSNRVGPGMRARAIASFARHVPASAIRARRIVQSMLDLDVERIRNEQTRGGADYEGNDHPTWHDEARRFIGGELLDSKALDCACCGLSDGERALLHRVHVDCLWDEKPLWAESACNRWGFTSVLIRYPDKRSIASALRSFPVPDDVLVFVLTSDKGAAARAKIVMNFGSHDGHRAKLAVLRRAMQTGNAPALFLKAGKIGLGRMLLQRVESFLARPRFLVADSTVDVGFDLHRHIDSVLVDKVPLTRTQVDQLTGRVSRIATDIKSQGTVDVLVRTHEGTLDSLFFKHLGMTKSIDGVGGEGAHIHNSVNVAARVRAALVGDVEAQSFFERIWSVAGASVVSSS